MWVVCYRRGEAHWQNGDYHWVIAGFERAPNSIRR
jgi:hypothetical protein